MAEVAVGTWKLHPSLAEGWDEYGEKTGIPAEKINEFKAMSTTVEISKNGEDWTVVSTPSNDPSKKRTDVFVLGKPKTIKINAEDAKSMGLAGATEVQMQVDWDGQKFVEKSNIGGMETVTNRRVEGDLMIEERFTNGAKLVSIYKRI